MSRLSRQREPVFNIPSIVIAVIVVLVAIHAGRSLLSTQADFDLLGRFAFVPARLTALFQPEAVAARGMAWVQSTDPEQQQNAAALNFFLQQPTWMLVTLVTYAGLHGDWAHLGFNSLWLLAFGTPVARRFGQGRFLALLGLAAVAGVLTHWLIYRFGVEPVIGASAAVSGCMGAALRFMFGSAPSRLEPSEAEQPDTSLAGVFRSRRALSFLVVWFGSNALFGLGAVQFGMTQSPVAWQAHVGGFLAGLLLFRFFDPSIKRDAGHTVPESSDGSEHP